MTNIPTHTIDGAYIKEWLILGPFFPNDLDKDFLADAGGEANIEPKEGDTVTTTDGTTLVWKWHHTDEVIIDLLKAVGTHQRATAYAFCILQSPTEVETAVCLGSDDGVAVWINGQRVHQYLDDRFLRFDQDVFSVNLKADANRCLIKIFQGMRFWEFAMRVLPPQCAIISGTVTDEVGNAIPDAFVHLEQDRLEIAQRATDVTGRYILVIAEPHGIYDLSVTAGDRGAWGLGFELHKGKRLSLPVRLKQAVSVEGTLLMLDNTTPHSAVPIQAVQVGEHVSCSLRSREQSAQVVTTTQSDEEGRYRFINLKPGTYQVRCQVWDDHVYYNASPHSDPREEIQSSTHQAQQGRVLNVEDGKTVSGVDFRFPPFKKGAWKNYTFLNGLADDQVLSIHCGHDGMVWFGTTSGVSCYDGKEFQNFTTERGLAHNWVYAIYGAPDGMMWFGTYGGVSRYDGKDFQNFTTEHGLVHNWVYAIYDAPDGVMWFGTYGGVSRYDGKDFQNLTTEHGLADNWVRSICRDENGVLWFGTWGRGVSCYDGETVTPLTIEHGLPDNHVAAIDEDVSAGTMWFGTEQGGISCYDRRDGASTETMGRFVNFNTKDGLPHYDVTAVYHAPDRTMWFGTEGGVSRYNENGFVNFTTKDGLVDNRTTAIHRGRNGEMWFGTNGGVSYYDENELVNLDTKNGIPYNNITALQYTSNGEIWFGTVHRGVFQYSRKGLTNLTTEDGLVNNWVTTIYCDADGAIWIGTDGGVSRYDENGFVNFTTRDGLTYRVVQAIYQDADGSMWFGTRWGGVCQYDGNTFRALTTKEGLANDLIWTFYGNADDGDLWVGTDGGVSRYNGKRFINFTTEDGLANNTVYAIYRDVAGAMWFGTGGGACCYDGARFVNFTTTSGLAHNCVFAIHQDSRGMMWFGTNGGGVSGYNGAAWTSLDTRDGLASNFVKSIHEDEAGVLWFGTEGGITPYRRRTALPSVRIMTVRTDKVYTTPFAIPLLTTGSRVTIEYSAIDFKTVPEKRQYRTRLQMNDDGGRMARNEGIEKWSEPTKATSFDWTPKEEGTYIFEVQAIDRGLNVSDPAMVSMTVRPDDLQTLVQSEVAHSSLIRPIRHLQFHVEEAKQNLDDPTRFGESFVEIEALIAEYSQNLDRFLELTRVEVGAVTSVDQCQSEPLNFLINTAIRRVIPDADEKGIKIAYDVSLGNELYVHVNDFWLTRVFEMLLDNAIKYTPKGGQITVRVLSTHGDFIELGIQDTGIGIPPDERERVFDKFKRGTNCGSEKGMGLGLPLVRTILDHFKGHIRVDSELGEGSHFVLTLPKGKEDVQQ